MQSGSAVHSPPGVCCRSSWAGSPSCACPSKPAPPPQGPGRPPRGRSASDCLGGGVPVECWLHDGAVTDQPQAWGTLAVAGDGRDGLGTLLAILACHVDTRD